MKTKIYSTIIALLLCVGMYAQAPQKFSYQAVVYNASNQLVINAAVGVKIAICKGAPEAAPVYVETHKPTTNANGLATIEIGSGTSVPANGRVAFSAIDWSTGVYYIRTKIDPTGGTNYDLIILTTQLLSVPYALYAEKSGPGSKGETGEKGDAGVNGSKILSGSNSPVSRMGVQGDYYLDTLNKKIYGPKGIGVWPAGISLKGDKGKDGGDGKNGSVIYSGSNGPNAPVGLKGDYYMDTLNKIMYGPRGLYGWPAGAGISLKGDKGDAGKNGSKILSGSGSPISTLGLQGDYYMDTLNKKIYGPKGAAKWAAGVSLQGAKGATGTFQNGTNPGDMYYWNGTAWTVISAGANGTLLTMVNGKPTWSVLVVIPEVKTLSVYDIRDHSVSVNVEVVNNGGDDNAVSGVCWGTSPNPVIDHIGYRANATEEHGHGKGTFAITTSYLDSGTVYYIRSYITNSTGTVYGNDITFTTLNLPPVDHVPTD